MRRDFSTVSSIKGNGLTITIDTHRISQDVFHYASPQPTRRSITINKTAARIIALPIYPATPKASSHQKKATMAATTGSRVAVMAAREASRCLTPW